MVKISVAGLGGTITMVENKAGEGAVPTLTADLLVQSVPALSSVAEISATTLLQVPSGALSFKDLMTVLQWAEAEVDNGADGIVVTQGTDTLEESSFWLDLYWNRDAPLVMTGAMRNPSQVGAEGAANLLAAVQIAAAKHARGRGVMVAMNDEIHSARWVAKIHAFRVDAFQSLSRGPLGAMLEGEAVFFAPQQMTPTLSRPLDLSKHVCLVENVLSGDYDFLRHALKSGRYSGFVLSCYGAGHVGSEVADIVGEYAKQVPLIIASRTGEGSTTNRTYGYIGSEIDLMQKGAYMAGWLTPRKARLLLWALVSAGCDFSHIGETFRQWNRLF